MRKRLTSRGVERQSDRERTAGLDPDDEAARWLAEHDPKPPPARPKSAPKSKLLHQWRQRNPKSD